MSLLNISFIKRAIQGSEETHDDDHLKRTMGFLNISFIKRAIRGSLLCSFVIGSIYILLHYLYLAHQDNIDESEDFNIIMTTNSEKLLTLQNKIRAPKRIIAHGINEPEELRLLKTQDYPISVYIKALSRSVQIIPLPVTLSLRKAIKDCKKDDRKSPLFYHQHSLELRFPYMLQEMSKISTTLNRMDYGLLWQRENHGNNIDLDGQLNDSKLNNSALITNEPPLFYYLETFSYYVVHCAYKKGGKENWERGSMYLDEIARHIVHTKEWEENMGVDFISPASHPKAAPPAIKTADISSYQRQTFMRTDFDYNGNSPKDIIVPYYVATFNNLRNDTTGALVKNQFDNTGSKNYHSKDEFKNNKKYFLYFAGGKNPPNGLRQQLEDSLMQMKQRRRSSSSNSNVKNMKRNEEEEEEEVDVLKRNVKVESMKHQLLRRYHHHQQQQQQQQYLRQNVGHKEDIDTYDDASSTNVAAHHDSSDGAAADDDDIFYSTNPLPYIEYIQALHSSTFCLSLRGDTASTGRLFSIIAAGCIPVIISDWLALPFESLIDYSLFSVRLPESSIHDPANKIIAHLRAIPLSKIISYRSALKAASTMLVYGPLFAQPLQQQHQSISNSLQPHSQWQSLQQSRQLQHYYLLNPVTLSLLEMLIRRKQYCDKLNYAAQDSSLCRKLYQRLSAAQK